MRQWPTKDPDETLDYSIDWSQVLAADDDTIDSVVWTIPVGLTKISQQEANGVATVWLSGGTQRLGGYVIACRLETTGGRTYDRSVRLAVSS
jgi:hypothetical protein